jgi:hypothetical protein
VAIGAYTALQYMTARRKIAAEASA